LGPLILGANANDTQLARCHTLGMAAEMPGTLVGAGRNADVFDVGDGRVLRRYRDGREARRVDTEAQVMVRARAAGVPLTTWAAWTLGCEAKSTLSFDDPLPFLRSTFYRLAGRRGAPEQTGVWRGRVRSGS